MESISRALRKGVIFLLRAYSYVISPLLGPRCRFYPNCSQYARDAVEQLGILRAIPLIIWRLLRCNPLFAGGIDPVPCNLQHQPMEDK